MFGLVRRGRMSEAQARELCAVEGRTRGARPPSSGSQTNVISHTPFLRPRVRAGLPFTANPEAVHDEPALAAWNAFMEQSHRLWDTSGKFTPSALAALGVRNANEQVAAEFMLWNARSNAPAIDNLLNGLKREDGRQSGGSCQTGRASIHRSSRPSYQGDGPCAGTADRAEVSQEPEGPRQLGDR